MEYMVPIPLFVLLLYLMQLENSLSHLFEYNNKNNYYIKTMNYVPYHTSYTPVSCINLLR